MESGTVKTVAVSAAVIVVGYLAWKASKAIGQAAGAVGNVLATDLNPASADNVVNRGVSAIGAAVSGDSAWSLGGWVYDMTHSDPLALPAPAPRQTTGDFARLDRANDVYDARYGGDPRRTTQPVDNYTGQW